MSKRSRLLRSAITGFSSLVLYALFLNPIKAEETPQMDSFIEQTASFLILPVLPKSLVGTLGKQINKERLTLDKEVSGFINGHFDQTVMPIHLNWALAFYSFTNPDYISLYQKASIKALTGNTTFAPPLVAALIYRNADVVRFIWSNHELRSSYRDIGLSPVVLAGLLCDTEMIAVILEVGGPLDLSDFKKLILTDQVCPNVKQMR